MSSTWSCGSQPEVWWIPFSIPNNADLISWLGDVQHSTCGLHLSLVLFDDTETIAIHLFGMDAWLAPLASGRLAMFHHTFGWCVENNTHFSGHA